MVESMDSEVCISNRILVVTVDTFEEGMKIQNMSYLTTGQGEEKVELLSTLMKTHQLGLQIT